MFTEVVLDRESLSVAATMMFARRGDCRTGEVDEPRNPGMNNTLDRRRYVSCSSKFDEPVNRHHPDFANIFDPVLLLSSTLANYSTEPHA